jgi:PAS domain S-box-containing protein
MQMDASEFSQRLTNWFSHLQRLQQRVVELSPPEQAIFEAMVEETLTAYEELRVADEELHQQQEALLRAREIAEVERGRYQELFEFAPGAYLVTDAHGAIQDANRAASTLFNRRHAYLLGKPLTMFIVLDNHSGFRTRLQQLKTSEGIHSWEDQVQPHEQSPIHVSITVTRAEDGTDKPITLRWLLRDISVRKQMELELRQARAELEQRVVKRTAQLTAANATLESEIAERHRTEQALYEAQDYLRLIFENITDYAIFSLDLAGRIHMWNPGAERLFGYTEAEALGQSGALIFTPEDRAQGAVEQEITQALEQGYARDDRWHQRKDGNRLFVNGVLRLMYDREGNRRGFIKVTQDVTQRKQAEEALEVAQAQAKRLATLEERHRIARDLHDAVSQTLFTSSLITETVARRDDIPEPLRPTLAELYRLNRGALAEMRILLLELRPDQLTRADLSTQLQQLIDALRARKRVEATLRTKVEAPLLKEIHVTFYRIAQEAFNNLIKHSQAKAVEISFTSTDKRVELRIRDDGVGFDRATVAGGLGLIGMQERAEEIDATLKITSQVGQGTEIKLVWKPAPER